MKHVQMIVVMMAAAGNAWALSPVLWDDGLSAVPLPGTDIGAPPLHESIPGPILDDGTPTKLYTLSLGRAWHNHTESAMLSAAVEAKKAARRNWQGRRSLYLTMEDTPLFPGWGTHYAYVYTGTPPQRVSVIVDTGSHFTAFPCAECRNCGAHTDPYWDSSKSSTSNVVTCKNCHGSFRCNKNKRCSFSQRYSEGSSWSAYQVEDVLWVGELTLKDSKMLTHDESAYAVDFMFGCIESQTGLFKTQLADGIMGMSADKHTLVWQLADAGKIKERIFSLCFSLNGGTMVLGGYDARLNKPGHEMMYTPTTKSSGWFTVKVNMITLNGVSITADSSVFQRGKGTIVDSGTTDTYLPKSVAAGFSKAWQAATGSPYKPCVDNQFCMKLAPSELEALPTLTIHLDGGVEVHVRPEAYMDALGKDNSYAPRIYMEESMGAVLGANVMRDHNVVFDFDNHRVGFAEGICDYKADRKDDAEGNGSKGDKPAVSGQIHEGGSEHCVIAKELVTECDVGCPLGMAEPKILAGHEKWVEVVVTPARGSGKQCPEQLQEELRACFKECPAGAKNPTAEGDQGENGNGAKGGGDAGVGEGNKGSEPAEVDSVLSQTIPFCSIEEEIWTECSGACLQERFMGDECEKEAEARPCHVGDHCATSKMGLLLSMGVTLELEFENGSADGDGAQENVQRVLGEKRPYWMSWVGTAVADAVAAQLSEVPNGDIEATISVVDSEATVAADGKATVTCKGDVQMHLTPKVGNNAANRASSALNIPTLSQALTASLGEMRHWQWPSVGFTVKFVSNERVSMFVASNGEQYLPPVNDRLQAENPRPKDRKGPAGTVIMMVAGAMVVLATGAIVIRMKLLRSPQDIGHQEEPEIEISLREFVSRRAEPGVVSEPEGGSRIHRKTVFERDGL